MLVLLDTTVVIDFLRGKARRREHASPGITLSQARCLIAAAAVEASALLATGNPKDFPMAGLGLEHWPTGPELSRGLRLPVARLRDGLGPRHPG